MSRQVASPAPREPVAGADGGAVGPVGTMVAVAGLVHPAPRVEIEADAIAEDRA